MDIKTVKGVIPFEFCLTDDQKTAILENSNTVLYKRKENIFRQNARTSHMMFVKSGMVKIFKEGRNSKFIILKVAVEGDFIGLLSVFGSDTHQYSATAVKDSEIVFVDISTFNKVLYSNKDFAQLFIQNVASNGLFIFDRLMSQSHKQLPGRIADVILYFSETIFKKDEFEFPFTRRELAELAGTTKESFIRTLAEFKNDKIINLDGSNVKINSMKIIKILSQLG